MAKKRTEKDEIKPQANEKKGVFSRAKHHFSHTRIYILIIVILVLWIFFLQRSKSKNINELKQQIETNYAEHQDEKAELLKVSGEEYLGLMIKTFSWAIRNEMLKEDYSAVNLYIGQLIRQKNVKEILVMDTEGVVVAASNRKQEEQKFSSLYDSNYLTFDKEMVEYGEDQEIYLSTPIMAFNNRIGNLFIVYNGVMSPSNSD